MKGWFTLLLAMMGASAFAEMRSGDYWYTLDESGNAILTHWEGGKPNLDIPSEIDGHPITAIGGFAFLDVIGDRVNLESVSIPEGVTTIKEEAFSGQYYLREVTLPTTLTTIEAHAFEACTQLSSIDLKNCRTIGDYVFTSCNALELDIPASVTSLGAACLSDIKSVTVAADNPIYEQTPEGVILTKEENATLVYVPSNIAPNYKIPEHVTTIGSNAFHGNREAVSITLPETVKTLEPFAFTGNLNLSLTIPKSVTTICESAFGTRGLGDEQITLVEGNPNYVQTPDGAILTKGENATLLYVPSTVDTFTIPETVTKIGDYAFYWNRNITAITIPEGVTTIGTRAFANCWSLSSISLPKSLKAIGKDAFRDCRMTSIDLPDGITTIETLTFVNCYKLTSIKIPSGVTRIDDGACFCTGLREVEIPEGVTFIGANAFAWCPLTTVTIPETVKDFRHDAFNYCDALKTIVFTGKPPVAENFPEEWRGKIWRIPSTEQEAWAEAKEKYADWGVTFETYIPPSKVTFDNAVPTEAQDWLRNLLAEAGVVEGSVTMAAEGAENLAFLRKYGVAPKWEQEGETVTLSLSDAEAFAALKAADAEGRLIGPEQIKEMAFTQPMIAVENDGVTVEIGLQTAETLGDWQALLPSLDATETTEEGRLRFHFSVPETSDAAFYRFVVPEGTHKATP